MTIADIAAKVTHKRELNILVYDIERMKGTAGVEFWSLSDFKHRRIHADDVIDWPRTICVAWRFLGDKRTEFASEWDDGPEDMHRRIWEAFDKADVTVGHNSKAFDEKHLNTGWRDLGMTPPSPSKPIDTLSAARARFGDESKTLDALCQRIGLAGKTDRYNVEVARAACDGDRAAQRKIRAYNIGDIDATEALYVTLLPWIKAHPHVAPNTGADNCPRCNSPKVRRNGTWTVHVWTYVALTCDDCGGHWKTTMQSRGPGVKTL
ncbi:MAG: hypothetical protein AVDCRST_MAG83-1709 [uncultured Arthrobacter sp.]|uniref:Uncharacterized protein n=1 Tax=uncultured Arthrobacter sp. TaxID=114050 RepID=A0A6J4I7B7_9MICC|nr:hypothetical protein [uncultured Arthrobacter sp.]CAA9242403.1 MAG: hypothetical protein AVDCRST_MAG83-1709 [uncultured Arthrobacter sp.]